MKVAAQALNRDPGWTKFAKLTLARVQPQPGRVSDVAIAQRAAFEAATDGDAPAAAEHLRMTADAITDTREKGWLAEQQAAYIDLVDPVRSQEILVEARRNNPSILRPLSGVTYQPLSPSDGQARTSPSESDTHRALFRRPRACGQWRVAASTSYRRASWGIA